MVSAYFEWRISAARGSESVAADIARHVHSRQHLGKTVVICDQPIVMLSAVRKQWLKLCRTIQKQRASTLNADKILKYTHTITRMQHMVFTVQSPLEKPSADLFFLTLEEAADTPLSGATMYVLQEPSQLQAEALVKNLYAETLIVDYVHSEAWKDLGLAPKLRLEEAVRSEWEQVTIFLAKHNIQPDSLMRGSAHNLEEMDDALDTLLGIGNAFLEIANRFQHAIEIARPLRTPKELRLQFDAVILLAHRVQALSPGAFTQRFLESYNEDDTFFLYDSLRADLFHYGESLAQMIERHRAAGRLHLADSLMRRIYTK